MRNKLEIAIVGIILLIFSACSKDSDKESAQPNFGYQYAPLHLSQEYTYAIDSIAYDDFTGTIDTIRFQRKYITESVSADLSGRNSYRIAVYERASDTLAWRKIRFVSKVKTRRTIEYLENNQTTIPLIFPVKELDTWDANALNASNEFSFRYKEAHISSSINGVFYDSIIVVEQRNEANLIEKYLQEEKYASQIGMVYKKDKVLKTELNGTIRNGYDKTYYLVEYKP
ncbi:MAG: hypothetical protein KDB74_00760 [Flavobacteriales bacterium]|nr:hypothetical protein [Flavobacteriales bacterium]